MLNKRSCETAVCGSIAIPQHLPWQAFCGKPGLRRHTDLRGLSVFLAIL